MRSDGSSIPMEMLTSLDNSTHCEISFQDLMRDKQRNGIISFIPPCYFHFRTRQPNGIFSINLLVLLAPISPGKTRIFTVLSPGKNFPIPLPKWLFHSLINKFLDSDIWVHDQERIINGPLNSFVPDKKAPKYILPTSSDIGCRNYRLWFDKHLSQSLIFGNKVKRSLSWISEIEQKDRYDSHIKHCIHCQTALSNAYRIKKALPILGFLLIGVSKNLLQRLLSVGVFTLGTIVVEWIIKSIEGPRQGERMSAAQLGN